jgi:hypothetical protein
MKLKQEYTLVYTFLMGNLVYGLGFSVAGNWSGVNSSSLFKSMQEVEPWLPTIWGGVLVAAVVLCVLSLRSKVTRGFGSVAGMGCWLYASLVYALTGYWLVVFSVGLLYLVFWVFYHFKFVFSKRP